MAAKKAPGSATKAPEQEVAKKAQPKQAQPKKAAVEPVAPAPAKVAGKAAGAKTPSDPATRASAAPPKKAASKASPAGPALLVGDALPALTLPDQDGQPVALDQLRGPLVLYFYPKDDTPGCTREACGFRDLLAELASGGFPIYGISADGASAHQRFRAKYELPFPLLTDADKTAAKAFGVWVEKVLYGKKSMGLERSTFLIDASGRIAKLWRRVKVDGHVEQVAKAVAALRAG